MPTSRASFERDLHARLHALADRGDLAELRAALDEVIATTMGIVDAARAVLGKVTLATQLVDLRDLVEGAVDAAAEVFSARAHSVALLVGSAPIWSRVDPARISEVVANLLDNAARYTPRGGRIVVCAESSGDRAVIRVRDNGVGISGDELAHIFEPFERRRVREQGDAGEDALDLGVGLAVVRGLVRLHGGEVTAVSRGVGLGAELVVTLPLVSSGGTWASAGLDVELDDLDANESPRGSGRACASA